MQHIYFFFFFISLSLGEILTKKCDIELNTFLYRIYFRNVPPILLPYQQSLNQVTPALQSIYSLAQFSEPKRFTFPKETIIIEPIQ